MTLEDKAGMMMHGTARSAGPGGGVGFGTGYDTGVAIGDGYIYTQTTAPWPTGNSATFDGAFSTANPTGASQPSTGR